MRCGGFFIFFFLTACLLGLSINLMNGALRSCELMSHPGECVSCAPVQLFPSRMLVWMEVPVNLFV